MAMTTCPNCGKQLRPGARFCGSCGATLPAGSSGKGQGAPAPAPAADTLPCPNCGKPVRKGAKFCSQCGHTILTEGAPGVPGAAEQTASPGGAPTLIGADAPANAQAAPSPAPARPAAAPASSRPRRGLPLILLAVLAVACLALAAGGYFVANRQGWLAGLPGGGGDLPSPTQALSIAPSETLVTPALPPDTELPPTEAPTSEPTLEPTAPPPTPTQAFTPTATQIPPSLLLSPTNGAALTLTDPTVTVTATAPISGALPIETVIDDVFDGPLSVNWLTWGDPRPTIDSGPGYKWLSLKADDPNAAGVTTRAGVVVMNAPGLDVEFSAAIQDRYPNSSLYLDWDPLQTRRGPDLSDPGVIRVGVSKDGVTLNAPLTRGVCRAALDGLQQHHYVLRVGEGYRLELYVDEENTPACTVEATGLAATLPGRVSFTGRGWITRVKIMQPVVEP